MSAARARILMTLLALVALLGAGPVAPAAAQEEPAKPVARPDGYRINAGAWLDVAEPGVLSNDTFGEGQGKVKAVTDPTQGTGTLFDNGAFLYRPAAGFAGTDTFTYCLEAGGECASDTVTLTIEVVRAVAHPDSYDIRAGHPLDVDAPGVLDNDEFEPAGGVAAAVRSNPAHGTATLSAAGSFDYTPAGGFAGTDTFTYCLLARGECISDPVSVTIRVAANQAPAAVDDSYETDEGTELTVAAPGVLDNDSDADGDGLAAKVATGPQHGTLTLNGDGSLTYRPEQGFAGGDSFTYTVTDGEGGEATATVSLVVNAKAITEPPATEPGPAPAAPVPQGGLATTGGPFATWLALGALLVIFGAVLFVATRRRSTP